MRDCTVVPFTRLFAHIVHSVYIFDAIHLSTIGTLYKAPPLLYSVLYIFFVRSKKKTFFSSLEFFSPLLYSRKNVESTKSSSETMRKKGRKKEYTKDRLYTLHIEIFERGVSDKVREKNCVCVCFIERNHRNFASISLSFVYGILIWKCIWLCNARNERDKECKFFTFWGNFFLSITVLFHRWSLFSFYLPCACNAIRYRRRRIYCWNANANAWHQNRLMIWGKRERENNRRGKKK